VPAPKRWRDAAAWKLLDVLHVLLRRLRAAVNASPARMLCPLPPITLFISPCDHPLWTFFDLDSQFFVVAAL